MTEQDLLQENEKLSARLKKAVEVFNEQKATIQRLTDERDAVIAKAKEAEEQDNQFFAQEEKIEELSNDLFKTKQEVQALEERLQKASDAYKKLQTELKSANSELAETNEIVNRQKEILSKISELCK